jgi:hypothetical protein
MKDFYFKNANLHFLEGVKLRGQYIIAFSGLKNRGFPCQAKE